MSPDLEVQNVSTARPLPAPTDFELWALAALTDSPKRDAGLVIRIVDETESRELNQTYRGKDSPTNVLSFPFESPPGLPPELAEDQLGDLVICAPVVLAEAAAQNKTPQAHWAHMLVHGVLHLLGYDHQNETDASIMESREREILMSLGFPDPYQNDHNL